MSKIGKKPIQLPNGVTLEIKEEMIEVKGPKGVLSERLPQGIVVVVADGQVNVTNNRTNRQSKADHGLVRSLINNMVIGVNTGYTKKLELVGTGYRAASKGQGLTLTVGFSHPVEIAAIEGIQLKTEGTTTIIVSGASKYLVGQTAANIRAIRPPEPYKGKGIRYQDEVVRRKQGKTAAK